MKSRNIQINECSHVATRDGANIALYRDLGGKSPFQTVLTATLATVSAAKKWIANPTLEVG